jgi:hypothetical protein
VKMLVRKIAREATTTVRSISMSATQGEEIPLTGLPTAPAQPLAHASMATHTPQLSSSETTLSTHDANIQPEADQTRDIPPTSFHQWEMYPENLSDYDVLDASTTEYHQKLEEGIKSGMLVGDPTKVETLTMHCTNGPGSPGFGRFPVIIRR